MSSKQKTKEEAPEVVSNLTAALAQFQLAHEAAKQSGTNPHFKKNYSTLQDVIDVVKHGSEYGLAFVQRIENDDANGLHVCTVLMHVSGEREESRVPIIANKTSAQGLGSGITYARRYGLSAIYGISSEVDDDGNAAVASTQSKHSKGPKPTEGIPAPSKPDLSPSNFKNVLALIRSGKSKEALAILGQHNQTAHHKVEVQAAFDALKKAKAPKPVCPDEDFKKALEHISGGFLEDARGLLKPHSLSPDQKIALDKAVEDQKAIAEMAPPPASE